MAPADDRDRLARREAPVGHEVSEAGAVEHAVGEARRERRVRRAGALGVDAPGLPRDGRAAGDLDGRGAGQRVQVGVGDARELLLDLLEGLDAVPDGAPVGRRVGVGGEADPRAVAAARRIKHDKGAAVVEGQAQRAGELQVGLFLEDLGDDLPVLLR